MKNRETVSSPDRLPPHSLEAEQGVLGCVLLDPPVGVNECRRRLRGGQEAFYDLRHQCVYEALCEMDDQRKPIDLITLQQHLKDKQQLEAVGGIPYLMSLADAVPSPANLPYYLGIVVDKHVLRRVIRVASDTVAGTYESEADVADIVDDFEKRVLELRGLREEAGGEERPIKAVTQGALVRVEAMYASGGKPTGLTTGLADLDKLLDGLHPREVFVVAGYPGSGKTALAMNIVEHVALDLDKPVGVFSMEMDAESLALRLLCSRARVNPRAIREGHLAERDFPKLAAAAAKLSKSRLHIRDVTNMSCYDFRAAARRLWREHAVELFVVDYLQLMHATSGGRRTPDSRQEEVAEISRVVKSVAFELKVPVLALSQLNDDGKLRESRAIGQDADTVGVLKRVVARGKDGEEDEDGGDGGVRIDLGIDKQRNGPTGTVELVFLKGFTRFESLSRVAAEDLPADDAGWSQ